MNINISRLNIELKNKSYIESKKSQEKVISSIYLYDFYIYNQINIHKKIKKIANYKKHFSIPFFYSDVFFGQVTEEETIQLQLQKQKHEFNEKKYILMKYVDAPKTPFLCQWDYIKDHKYCVALLLESYSNLLNSFIKLNENGMCYFTFTEKNIYFYENNVPMIEKFDTSVSIEKLDNPEYFYKFLDTINIESLYNLPFEIYIIYYLHYYEVNSLSILLAEDLSESFIKNQMYIPIEEKKEWINICKQLSSKYINKKKDIIMLHIIQYVSTWDNYFLSLLYMEIINNKINKNILSALENLLKKNLHPNPILRESIVNTKAQLLLII